MHAPTRNYHSSAVRYHDYCYFNTDLHACVFTHTLESNLDPNADEERNDNADASVCHCRARAGLPEPTRLSIRRNEEMSWGGPTGPT